MSYLHPGEACQHGIVCPEPCQAHQLWDYVQNLLQSAHSWDPRSARIAATNVTNSRLGFPTRADPEPRVLQLLDADQTYLSLLQQAIQQHKK
jgi:hypothetical protein